MFRRQCSRHFYVLPMLLAGFLATASTAHAHVAGQTPVVMLTLSASSVPAGTVVTVQASVSDVNGSVAGGIVDFFDGSQLSASVQVVRSNVGGSAVGSATLRRVFAPGTHTFHAAFLGTVGDAPAASALSTLLVGPAAQSSGNALVYAGTRDMAQGTNYNFLSDIAVADFNQDGFPDIAATLFEPTVLALSLGDPANPGQFLAPRFYPLQGDEIDRVLAVDLNADGLMDLIVEDNDAGHLFLFLNNPASPGTFLTPTTVTGSTFAVADFNRDGLPDIIEGDRINGELVLKTLLNNPGNPGTFVTGGTFAAPGGAAILWGLQTADMNGDGVSDVVYTYGDATDTNLYTVTMLGDPANPGGFLAPTAYSPGGLWLSVGDVNLDGVPDVLVQASNGFNVFLGDPTHPGTLLASSLIDAGYYGYQPTIGDVNGDGKPDVVVGYIDNTIRVFAGNGDGTFQSPVAIMTGPTAPAWENSAIVLQDIDGDGLLDMLTSSDRQNAVQIFRHQVTGTPLIRTSTDMSLSTGYVVLQNQTEVITATETATSGMPSGTVEFYDTRGGSTYNSLGIAPIVNGIATMQLSNLSLGYHDFALVFHGDNVYAPSESALGGIFVDPGGGSSTTTLSANPNPAALSQSIALRATVSGPGSKTTTPTGSIQFFDGNTSLGTLAVSAASATLTISTLSAGTHSITAVYSGDSTFSASTSAAISVLVQGAASAVMLGAAPNPAQYGAAVTLSAVATSAFGTPSGMVTFLDGTNSLGSATLSVSGTATIVTTSLIPGTHSLSVAYAGDATHSSATSNQVPETIGLAASSVALVATPSSAAAFQPISLLATVGATIPVAGASLAGSVTFFANGVSIGSAAAGASGVATLSTGALGSGVYSLTATYAGNASYAAGTSSIVAETVRADATSVRLTVNPNPALQQQPLTYNVSVVPALSSRTPDGTVTISEGASILGAGTLTSQGILSASLSPLPPGIHLLTATYGGNANFQASSSAPLSLQILAQDFNLATSVTTLSIETEHHAPLTVSVAALGGLQDTANLSCDNLPPHATCTFASSRIALGAASESTQLMVDTDDVLYYAENSPAAMRGPVLAGVLAGSCGLLGLLRPAVRRRRRLLPWLAAVVMAAMSMFLSAGCSGKYPAHTAPGQYSITVVAHGEQTGLTHTAPVMLSVTP